MERKKLLSLAAELISQDRAAIYGDARENHSRIARIWSALLDQDITPEQVYMCMIAVKLARLTHMPDHEDSWVDIAGYAALGGEAWEPEDLKGIME